MPLSYNLFCIAPPIIFCRRQEPVRRRYRFPDWKGVSPTNIALYTVQPGDTVDSIATKFAITAPDLSYLNCCALAEPLVVGQSIIVPAIRKTIQSLAYFHLADLKNLNPTLQKIGACLTYGGLFQFPITAAGEVQPPENIAVDWAVRLLKSYGIEPLAVITNLGALGAAGFDRELAGTVLGDKQTRAALTENLLSLMQRYGFRGVNIDFENVAAADRERFTAWIRELQQFLGGAGYLVSLTVPPKNADLPDDPVQGAYSYSELGQWADFIFIMTYDWGYIGGPPRAVAPLNEVQKVIAYAVTQIPADRILQGIPLYGYNWQLPYTPEVRATVVNLVEVYDLARRYQAAIDFDPVAVSPSLSFRANDGNDHIIWFEDARSLKAKYKLAIDFDLGGVGFWYGKNAPYGFPQGWVVFEAMFAVVREESCLFYTSGTTDPVDSY